MSTMHFGEYQDELTKGHASVGAFVVATAMVIGALGAAMVAGQGAAPIVKKQEEKLDVTFVEKVAPPPPPPAPPVVKAPPPKPVAAPSNVPKHIKKVVVKKLPKAKKIKVPVKIKKTKLAEGDPGKSVMYVQEGAGQYDPDANPGLGSGVAFANPKRLPPAAQAPKPLPTNAMPKHPEVEKSKGIEDVVWLRVIIGTDGSVKVDKVIKGKPAFVQAALDAVNNWRFRPAKENGQAITVYKTIKIPFRIRA